MIKRVLLNIRQYITDDKNTIRIFSVIFIFFGLGFVFLVPPFQNPDEPMHFYRSYQVSEPNILADRDRDGRWGGEVPKSMNLMIRESQVDRSFDFDFRFDPNFKELLSHRYDTDGTTLEFQPFPNTAIYSPIPYLQTALGHKLIATFDLPMLLSLYLGRILSLVVVLLAFVFALKYSPIGKWAFVAVGLIPMTIASAASISSDAVTLAVSIAFMAAVLNITFKKSINIKWIIICSVLAVSLALVKQAHVVLVILLILPFIVNKQYRKPALITWLIGLIGFVGLVAILWYLQVGDISLIKNPLVQPELQKHFILTHPLSYVTVLFETFATSRADAFVASFFGNFGWLTVPMPILSILLSVFVIYIATKQPDPVAKRAIRVTPKQKILLLVIALSVFALTSLLIATALYLYWTPYKLHYVEGLQGRYFLPIFLLVLLPAILFAKKLGTNSRMILWGLASIVLLIAVVSVYGRFYVATPVY